MLRKAADCGRKAMALSSLMGMIPSMALGIVSDVVSVCGWKESWWTGDALASKRILPGSVLRVV